MSRKHAIVMESSTGWLGWSLVNCKQFRLNRRGSQFRQRCSLHRQRSFVKQMKSGLSDITRATERGAAAPEHSSSSMPVTQVETAAFVQPGSVLGSKKSAKELWVESQHVKRVDIDEVEKIYLDQGECKNTQDIFLIMYAPWCPHCRMVEAEVERLAKGLAHESSLTVAAMNCDAPAARYFAKSVLGLSFMPSFVVFPKGSKTFYKYKGKGRDAASLLHFLNMVCNQHGNQQWQMSLSAATSAATAPATLGQTSYTQFADPTVAIYEQHPLASVAVIALAVAAGAVVARNMVHGVRAADAAAAGATGASAASSLMGPRGLIRDIDSSISSMANLIVKLFHARLGLSVSRSAQPEAGATTGAADTAGTAGVIEVKASKVSPAAGSSAATGPNVVQLPAKPIVQGTGATSRASNNAQGQNYATAQQMRGTAASSSTNNSRKVAVDLATARQMPLPIQMKQGQLKKDAVSIPHMSAERLLAMLDEEKADVSKVLHKLMEHENLLANKVAGNMSAAKK